MASKQVDGLMTADPLQYDALKSLPHLDFYQVMTAETGVFRAKMTEKPYSDPRVRKAMRLAIDCNAVLQVGLRGFGETGEHTHVAPVQPDYGKLSPFPHDVAAAKKLLAEAGYPNGFDTELFTSADPHWLSSQSLAAIEQWKAVGIRATLKVLPGQQYYDIWDKVPFGCTVWYHRPLGVMVLGLGYRSGVPWNESSYSNPEFDKLLADAEGTVDLEKRQTIMTKLEQIMQEDGPITQPIWRSNFTFYDKKVKGFSMHPTSYIFGNRLAIQP
jgi:peptide/nickel transport system substrate-binding protein